MSVPHQTIINIRYEIEIHEKLPSGQINATVKKRDKGSKLFTFVSDSINHSQQQIDDFFKLLNSVGENYIKIPQSKLTHGEENENSQSNKI